MKAEVRHRYINLTLPVYPYMPVGNVWAWDSPFRRSPITTVARHGVEMYHMSFHNEMGTRLMLSGCYEPHGNAIADVDFSALVERPTVVLDIPKGPREEIEPDDLDHAFKRADLREGDAVLIRTGWGSLERLETLGDDYSLNSPHFATTGANRLVELMGEIRSQLMLVDTACIGNLGEVYMGREWSSRKPWDRPPFPSDAARAYLRHYTPKRGAGGGAPDWAASVPLHGALTPVVGLAGCPALKGERVRVTVAPVMLANCPGAPATVIAREEDE